MHRCVALADRKNEKNEEEWNLETKEMELGRSSFLCWVKEKRSWGMLMREW